MSIQRVSFPYSPSIDQIARVVEQVPYAFFLDSASRDCGFRRYSYVGRHPVQMIRGCDSPWNSLTQLMKKIPSMDEMDYFGGGVLGYLSYECGDELLKHSVRQGVSESLSRYWFGLYESVLVFDHLEEETFLASWCLDRFQLKRLVFEWMELFEDVLEGENRSLFACESAAEIHRPDYEEYCQNIDRIHDYLVNGDVYQINFTELFSCRTSLPSSVLYQRLRKLSPAPYGAFLNTEEMHILSASPECYVQIDGHHIETHPIKGTIPRSGHTEVDLQLQSELRRSEKDRAELLMITDLERHDLGKVCQVGSVRVKQMNELQSFAQVHHLVSIIEGTLKEGVSHVDAVRALFPGGSITGAPKVRAMEIIQELEKCPRSVYTGALGFLGCGQYTMMNLPIRTMIKRQDEVQFYAGGGIVIDSQPKSEYEEMLAKASGMIKALLSE